MSKELKDILTDILEIIERLARGYDKEDIINYLNKTYIKINSVEVKDNE